MHCLGCIVEYSNTQNCSVPHAAGHPYTGIPRNCASIFKLGTSICTVLTAGSTLTYSSMQRPVHPSF